MIWLRNDTGKRYEQPERYDDSSQPTDKETNTRRYRSRRQKHQDRGDYWNWTYEHRDGEGENVSDYRSHHGTTIEKDGSTR